MNTESPQSLSLREMFFRSSLSNLSGSGDSISSSAHNAIFIPTTSTLLVHAAMKEAIRSERAVVVVGCDKSRKTTLIQNFLKHIDAIKALSTSSCVNILDKTSEDTSPNDQGVLRRRRAVLTLPAITGNNTSSVERIRMHHVLMVKRLAKRFRKANKSTSDHEGSENAEEKKIRKAKAKEWSINPTRNEAKAAAVKNFDAGDFIPFFYAMHEFDSSPTELEKCFDRMLQRERRGVFEPPPGKTAVLILDDLHLPVRTQQTSYPSCYDYLRSVCDLSKVVGNEDAKEITVEGLMTVSSMNSREVLHVYSRQDQVKFQSLKKLFRRLFPVLAPSCSPEDLQSIFSSLVLAGWELKTSITSSKVSVSIKQALSMISAASVVLMEQTKFLYKLEDANSSEIPRCDSISSLNDGIYTLMHVINGICSVTPSFIMDGETLFRLWAHETLRSYEEFQDPPKIERTRQEITTLWRLATNLQQKFLTTIRA